MMETTQEGGRVRQPKLVTRSQILDRAYEMYCQRELVQGSERLSLVLESLGYTTGAGYQIWPNQEAFRKDLQLSIAGRLDYQALAASFSEAVDSSNGTDPVRVVQEMSESLCRAVLNHEDFYRALRFLALGSDCPSEALERLAAGRSSLEAALAASFERLMERVEGLGPACSEQLSVSVLAVLEGFALRARVTRDPAGVYAPVVTVVLSMFGFVPEELVVG